MQTPDSLNKAWGQRARSSSIEPTMTISADGLVLGAGTVLAKQGTDRWDRTALEIKGNDERIVALLSVAYGKAVDAGVIDHIQHASEAYGRGETCLALIH